jgi:hypothetical protein
MLHVSCHFDGLYLALFPRRTIAGTVSAHRMLQLNALILWKVAWLVPLLMAWEKDFGSCCDAVGLEWTMSAVKRSERDEVSIKVKGFEPSK